jgi:hypothetical protein
MLSDQVDAFVRICAIADDIAEAEDIVHLRPVDDRQSGLKRLEVCVDIGEDCDARRDCTLDVGVRRNILKSDYYFRAI